MNTSRQIGDLIDQRFRLVKYIGGGGMGAVFKAADTKHQNRPVAIKLLISNLSINSSLQAELHRRFEREIWTTARLGEHPLIVTVLDSGIDRGQPYLVMEYLGEPPLVGINLSDLIAQESCLDLQRGILLAKQICIGLHHAHTFEVALSDHHIKGVIHRDVKPSNLFVLQDPILGETIRILDFGISKAINDVQATQNPQSLAFVGTVQYSSPEQLRGEILDPRSDIYSLGIVLFEMFTGSNPLQPKTNTFPGWYQAHNYLPPRRFHEFHQLSSDLPPSLETLILACLEKDPNQRPQSMLELAEALQAQLTSTLKPAAPTQPRGSYSSSVTPEPQAPTIAQSRDHSHQTVSWASASPSSPPDSSDPAQPESQKQQPRWRLPFERSDFSAIKGVANLLKWGKNRRDPTDQASSNPASVSQLAPTLIPESTSSPHPLLAEFQILTINEWGQECDRRPGRHTFFREPLTSQCSLDMVLIPGGEAWMGSPTTDPDHHEHEDPYHQIQVEGFWMSKYLITQAQWRVVASWDPIQIELNAEPAYFKGDDQPVERVSWFEAVEFCDRLTQRTGRSYRLPTEAEWEYACRAGTSTPFYCGATLTSDLSNYDAHYTFQQENPGQHREMTTPIGCFPPNGFGLYDMHGNVWEWCADLWHPSYAGAPTDGSVWDWDLEGNLEYRVLRGGSWVDHPSLCRSAHRHYSASQGRSLNVGIRICCDPIDPY